MATPSQPEVWQRGPVEGIPALLQPVAHALLQAGEEIDALMQGFDDTLLWERPAGVASPGFHLQHLSGVIDRLLTYARNESLSPGQLELLRLENEIQPELTAASLTGRFHEQVRRALQQLSATNENTLADFRGIGRKQIPTTVLGLLVHSAEHTMRHVGQLNVTVRVLKGLQNG